MRSVGVRREGVRGVAWNSRVACRIPCMYVCTYVEGSVVCVQFGDTLGG